MLQVKSHDFLANQSALNNRSITTLPGSPGRVVMGGVSCSEGRGFESHHSILDGHFSHLFFVKIVMFV